MSAPHHGPEYARGPRPAEVQTRSDIADRELLEKALECAEKALSTDDPLDVADVEALREVGRRRAGEPFSPEPVAGELVEAMLRVQLGPSGLPGPDWRRMVRRISETLLEDPASRARLEALWSYLSGGAT